MYQKFLLMINKLSKIGTALLYFHSMLFKIMNVITDILGHLNV